jgi:hypothetical protein
VDDDGGPVVDEEGTGEEEGDLRPPNDNVLDHKDFYEQK